jgi:hypothetical protein
MAKIRGIKPDLWTDEDFVELSPFARLLWLGLWNFSCDNGHVADKPKQIKMRVLPTDDVNCTELLREIESQGLIERTDGWITTPNLTRHQKVDRRYFTTCEKEGCNPPAETVSQRESRRVHAVQTTGTQRAHVGGTASALGDGDGEVKGSDGDSETKATPRGSLELNKRTPEHPIPEDWKPSEKHAEIASAKGLDLGEQAFRFRNHALANDRRQRNWNAAFNTWLSKAVDFAPAKGAQPSKAGEWWR